MSKKKPTETYEEGTARLIRYEAAKATGDTAGMWDNANAPAHDEPKGKLWNVWLLHKGRGWWLEEEGYTDLEDAFGALNEFMSDEMATDVVGGCVVLKGQRP